MLNRKFDLRRDIERLRKRLLKITELKELTEMKAWSEVHAIFVSIIGTYTQEILDLCSKDPRKHADEIRCKKMVADTLGTILTTVDSRANSREVIEKQIDNTNALLLEQNKQVV